MNISQARAQLPDLLTRVGLGEEFTITRHGEVVAVLVRPDRVKPARTNDVLDAADALREALALVRVAPSAAALTPETGLTAGRADELVAQIRAGRLG